MTLLAGLRRRLRGIPRSDRSWIVAWVGVALLMEVHGRTGGPDAVVGNVVVLGALAVSTLLRHAVRPIEGVTRAGVGVRRLVRRLSPWRPRFGFDLRETPPIERGVPRVLAGVVLAGGALLLVALAGRAELAPGLAFLGRISHALHAALLALLWGVLVLIGFALLALPVLALAERARARSTDDDEHLGPVVVLVALELLLVSLGCTLTSPDFPLGIVGGVLLLLGGSALLPWMPHLALLFREERPRPRLGSIRWSVLVLLFHAAGTVLGSCLVVIAVGSDVPDRIAGDVSVFLGEVFAWALAGASLLHLAEHARLTWTGLRHDPARPRPVRLRVVGPVDRAALREARARLTGQDLVLARAGRREARTDVRVRFQGDVDAAGWPRSIEPHDLEEPEVIFALMRRGTVLRRRELYRGLRTVFRAAGASVFERGSGFFLGPHRWFVTHLVRDVDEETQRRIGPAFRKVLSADARAHLYEVMAGLELDLIFVEDGVGFRRLKRVLSALFEFHDVFGGRRPFDERYAQGLPGVRTLVHEHVMGAPPRTSSYPEPEYDDIGRARILHVFRDRGEDLERAEAPRERDGAPLDPAARDTLLPAGRV